MNKIHSILLLIFINILMISALSAQKQNPPTIKWKKIDTEHFEIVFPENLKHEGTRVANLLEHVYTPVSKNFNIKPKPISLFLFNQLSISNAYVALAPRRTIWYNTPSQEIDLLGTIDWYETLSVHEFRHVVQYEKTRRGFTKFASILFGDYGHMIFSHLSVPPWFWEGDAVLSETIFSNSGRGRIPKFDMDIRTKLLTKTNYPYHKALLGSYKNYIPNHYHFGYQLVTHGYRKYGKDFWNKVIDRSAKYSFWPYTFSNSMWQFSGKTSENFFYETMSELDSLWSEQSKNINYTKFTKKNRSKKKVFTNYSYPHCLANGDILAKKTGLGNVRQFVRIDSTGNEKFIAETDAYGKFSLVGNTLAWESDKSDVRWGEKSYSNIVVFNMETGKKKYLTRKAKFYSPAISPDEKKIAVVEYSALNKSQLVIIDARSGKEIKRFENPDNQTLRTPAWSDDGTKIVMSKNHKNKIQLVILDYETGKESELIALSDEAVANPVFYKNFVLYNSPISGIDNIYAVNIDTKKHFSLTSSKFGAFNGSIDKQKNKLIYQNYTEMGFDIVETAIRIDEKSKEKNTISRNINYFKPIVEQQQAKDLFAKPIPENEYPIVKYSEFKKLLNFHSWVILPFYPTSSLLLFSNNKLNTMNVETGLEFNFNEGTAHGVFNLSLSKYYPIFDLGLSYGKRTSRISGIEGKKNEFSSWKESAAAGGIRLPLNLSKGTFTSYLEIGAFGKYVFISDMEYEMQEEYANNNGDFFPLSYRLNFYAYSQQAMRDIHPRFGFDTKFSYHHTPFDNDYQGELLSLNTGLYIPGFFKHHSIKFEGNFEKQSPENYRFESEMPYPRGYTYYYFDKIGKISANYALPLLYPDLNIIDFLFIKRVRTNLFYDYGKGKISGKFFDHEKQQWYKYFGEQEFQSLGAELIFDFHLCNLPIEINAGVRSAFKIKEKELSFDFLVLGIKL